MTGLTTRTQPVMVVENKPSEIGLLRHQRGSRKVMRFGATTRKCWIGCAGPGHPRAALGRAVRQSGGIALKPLIARGLTMATRSSAQCRLLEPADAAACAASRANIDQRQRTCRMPDIHRQQ